METGRFLEWLQHQLEARRWSKRQLALEMGVAPSTVQRWFKDHTRPDYVSTVQLAGVLGVQPEAVLHMAGWERWENRPRTARAREIVSLAESIDWEFNDAAFGMIRTMLSGLVAGDVARKGGRPHGAGDREPDDE
jgi:transcriptional regulator with XRE-family HTH domain